MTTDREQSKNWRLLRTWRPYFLIFVLGFLLYSQTLFFDFTYFDDKDLILENYPIIGSFKNIGLIFGDDVFFHQNSFFYRPLLNLFFMSEASIFGTSPFIFHLTHILIHILAAVLIFRLFLKWQSSRALAFFLALLFLVHPVLTQAVSWIPGRNDSLLTVFVLAAFLSFLNFSERPRWLAAVSYLIFFFLALLTKETAISLPFLVILYFLFLEPKKITRPDRWLLVGGSLAIVFIWILMRRFAISDVSINYLGAGLSIIQNLPGLVLGIGKIIFPFNLSVFPTLNDSSLVYGIIAIYLLFFAWFLSRAKRRRHGLFGLVWFLIFLLPSFASFANLNYNYSDFLEHRLYLPAIGFLMFLAEIDWVKNLDFNRKRVRLIIIFILLIFAGLTWRQSTHFHDRLTFWQTAVKNSPHSSLTQAVLGKVYYLEENPEAAVACFQKVITLYPQAIIVHNDLGLIYLQQKKYYLAEQEFRAELKNNPNYSKALFNLGNLYYQQKKYLEVLQTWKETLPVSPLSFQAYERLLISQSYLK
jgi:tetratricopeptide (TPR) repeat protein